MMRKSSAIWYHFTPKEANRGECNYCKSLLSTAGGSVGNLKRHLKLKHPTVPFERNSSSTSTTSAPRTTSERSRSPLMSLPASASDLSQARATSSGSKANEVIFQPELRTPSPSVSSIPLPTPRITLQSNLTDFIDVIKPLTVSKTKTIDLQLLKMICKEYHPFSLVEDPEFKKFVSLLCPGYHLPSRKTLSQSLLPQAYDSLVGEIEAKLSTISAVALTTDGWTSANNQSFYAITAHYLDENTSLCSTLLGCIEFEEKHTAANLATMLKGQCKEWGIDNKITAIVTDNAANIVAAVKLCQWRHIPCYAHTLNLIVKASIKPIEGIVEKLKALVQFFKKSSHALNKLHSTQVQMGLPQLKLKQDVPTRWNSTYEMLSRVIANKAPIISTLALLENDDFKICSEDWVVAEHSIKILEVFDEVTKEISSEKTVSLSKTMILSRNLSNYVLFFSKTPNLPKLVLEMCNLLHKKIEERWNVKECSELITQSALLDPRFKTSAFKNPSKYNQAYNALVGQIQSLISNEPSVSNDATISAQCSSYSRLWADFDTEVAALTGARDNKASSIIEIDKYLAEPLLPRVSDPLLWWEHRRLVYPHLYKVALKRLCIPASSVPCERIFSKAGQTQTERRSRLTSSKMSKILFLNCNF